MAMLGTLRLTRIWIQRLPTQWLKSGLTVRKCSAICNRITHRGRLRMWVSQHHWTMEENLDNLDWYVDEEGHRWLGNSKVQTRSMSWASYSYMSQYSHTLTNYWHWPYYQDHHPARRHSLVYRVIPLDGDGCRRCPLLVGIQAAGSLAKHQD